MTLRPACARGSQGTPREDGSGAGQLSLGAKLGSDKVPSYSPHEHGLTLVFEYSEAKFYALYLPTLSDVLALL